MDTNQTNLSVVSGSYNRLPYLKKMVASARNSILGIYGIRMEFVIVDANSQDGTQEWCREQPDIILIEHGRLYGAVKAFNDGAYAAKGEYVILANDDIEFLEDTILRGYIHMQANPDCGIGAFYQNRNGHDWHVEYMPVVLDGRQTHLPYGQVCIIPRWLGNKVGWWGTPAKSLDKDERNPGELYTYGGDNEISSRVYELGFRIDPVGGTKVHDNEADDELRKLNNITDGKDPRAVRGHHPDSWSWGKKWRNERLGLVGPVVGNVPQFKNEINERPRIIYLPVYEQGWEIQKKQKRGLREALAKVGLVVEYDYLGRDKSSMLDEIRFLFNKLKPTLFLSQIHNGDVLDGDDIRTLKADYFGTVFVNWNGDYWPENLVSESGIKLAKAFDIQTTINLEVLDQYDRLGVNAEYWQIGWEPDGVGYEPEIYHDVVFLASGYTKKRHSLVSNLMDQDFSFGLYGSGWPEGWAKGQNLYDFISACKIYRGAKIAIGDSMWPETGFVSNRLFQSTVAGNCVVAYQKFKGMEDLGYVDGETIIGWSSIGELIEKINYYLKNEDERQRISNNGQQIALQKHSFDRRVSELFQMIKPSKFETYEMEIAGENWRW